MTKPIIAALDPHHEDIAPAALGKVFAHLTGQPLAIVAAYHADPQVDALYPLSGDVARALAAASEDLDLLVCGARGHGPIRTLLLGGTSHALVRKAACPVLVVPLGSHLTASDERGPGQRDGAALQEA